MYKQNEVANDVNQDLFTTQKKINISSTSNGLKFSQEKLKIKSEELRNRNLLIEINNIIQMEVVENSILIDGDPSTWSQITSESGKERKRIQERTEDEIRMQAIIDVDKIKKRLEEIDIVEVDHIALSIFSLILQE